MNKPRLSFWQIWNMSFGFFGIQFGWGLQMGNMSAIYEYLGAKESELPLLWLAAPLTGLIVQPIIGHMSDRTWGPLGRRRPYFLVGAILASLALVVMPHSSVLWMAAGMLWILDASVNVCMEPFRAFVADQLRDQQRPAGYAMQTFFIGVGAVVAGLMPYMFAQAGVSNEGTGEGAAAIADTVRYSFYCGAAVLFVALLWTVLTTREYPPAELHAFADATPETEVVEPGRAARARQRGVVWLLVGLVAAVAPMVRVEVRSAGRDGEALRARYLARAGVQMALVVLQRDETAVDGPEDEWATLGERGVLEYPLGDGIYRLEVIDASSRIDLNRADRETLLRLPQIDEQFDEVTEGEENVVREKLKRKWATLETLVGHPERVALVARTIVEHFEGRIGPGGMAGKGMIVCMSRRICMDLYDALIALRPQWHDESDDKGFLKVIMTGDPSEGPRVAFHAASAAGPSPKIASALQ